MPCQVSRAPHWLLIELSGTVTADEFSRGVEAVDALESDPTCPRDRIYDVAGHFARDLAFSKLNGAVERRRAATYDKPVRTAVVAMSPAALNIAKLFQKLNLNEQLLIEIFKTRGEAEGWIRG